MEFSRQSIADMKSAIKQLSAEQKDLRPQRKTVHFQGTRTVPEWKATSQHQDNRYQLAHMFYAYSIMRGKEPVPFKHKPLNNNLITKILEKYGTLVHPEQN